jgi:hypothetical protein
MSYLGNSPELNSFVNSVEKFNGSGACTQYTLTRSISDPTYIEVAVGGVILTPSDAYTVTSGLITFNTPPALGTNNIVVIYRTGTTIAYNQISSSQILANSITSTGLAPSSVTNSKLAAGSITGDKLTAGVISSNSIVLNAITTNLIASQAVAGNQIGLGAITGNNFAGPITGNMIGSYAISGNQISTGAITGNNFAGPITGNMIGSYAISGNQIGVGAVSANNFAGGGITSNVLSSNLSISTTRIAETINLVTSSVVGNYAVHVGNTGVYYFTSNTSGSVTFNLIANTVPGTTGKLNDLISTGQSASVVILLKQGSTRYRANVQVDGVLQTAYWLSNAQPSQASSQSQSLDVYNFTVIKTNDSAFTVLAANSAYAQANGQGMGPGLSQ